MSGLPCLPSIGFFRISTLNGLESQFNDNPENPHKLLHANNESEKEDVEPGLSLYKSQLERSHPNIQL